MDNIFKLFLDFSDLSVDQVSTRINNNYYCITRDQFRAMLKDPGFIKCESYDNAFLKYGSFGAGLNNQEVFLPVAQPYLGVDEFSNLIDAYFSGWISSQGSYVIDFEQRFSKKFNAGYSVSCSNGTSAIQLALLALGIGAGDEVLCPDFTFAATANAILSVGASPIFIDSTIDNWCLDPEKIESVISDRVRAIVVVHVFGQVSNMKRIKEIAVKYGLYIIEDNAEALGSKYDGEYTGTIGDIGTYSFFANKMITTGEGGMCTTKSIVIAERMKEIRDHGMRPEKRYWHNRLGLNLRMTNLQAAIGVAQLSRIDKFIEERKRLESLYVNEINPNRVVFASNKDQLAEPVVWFVSALVDVSRRKQIIDEAKLIGIDIRPFFKSLSTMPAFEKYGKKCQVSEKIAECGINLPTHSGVNLFHISKIAHIING